MGKIIAEIELKVSVAKIWKAFQDPQFLPKAIPEKFKCVEIIEGDGVSAGSIRKVILAPNSPHGEFLLEKIVSVHKDSHTIVTEQIEGGLIGKIFSFAKITFKFHAEGAHKTKLIWEFEYEALVADPPLEQVKAGSILTVKSIETFLISCKEYD